MWIDTQALAAPLPFLDSSRFASLCNDLLVQTAIRQAIPRDRLVLNLRITEPDGGIDARCVDAPGVGGRLFPRSNCTYQFKGGNTDRSAASLARDDIFQKPRVRQAISDGHAVVFLIARDHGDAFESNVYREARELGLTIEDGQLTVVTGSTFATLLQAIPALACSVLHLDMLLLRFDDWEGQRRLRNLYQTDERLTAQQESLRVQMRIPGARVRIVGAPGDGKTRTVLEAIRATEFEKVTLYADQPQHITGPILQYLRNTHDAMCLLVVDEVDDDTADRLRGQCDTMPEGVRLIMIGLDASGRSQPETLQVEGLSEDLLVATILSIAAGLPEPVAREIAQVCERSPKLAVLIATRIMEDPSLVSPPLRLADRTIQSVLDRYLDLREDDWVALSGAALLERLGWTEAAEQESITLYTALGLDPTSSRRRVEIMHERYGIAPLAGRLRYISPGMLGDHLAARHLDGWTGDGLRRFIEVITPAMKESLFRRLRRLTAVLRNREIVEVAVLGDRGPFRGLTALENDRLGPLVRNLAGAFPHAVLRMLQRIVSNATIEELRAAKDSRRDLVWSLEELLWREDTFEQAAGILLRLAIAENETWANSATGAWSETFQTMLGRTAAGLEPRLRVIQSAARNKDPEARRLAAVALNSALKIGHLTRFGNPPTDVPDMPTQEWRPKTFAEWAESILQYLEIVQALLKDESQPVRMSAVEALSTALDAAMNFPPVLPKWFESVRLLHGAEYDLKSKIIHSIDMEINREIVRREENRPPSDRSEEEQKMVAARREEIFKQLSQLRAELLGDSFSARLRSTAEQDPWALSGEDLEKANRLRQEQIERLASEAVSTLGLLDTEWKWLLANQGTFPEVWAETLGRVDIHRAIASVIENLAAREKRAIGWLSLYEIANAETLKRPSRIDTRIDELMRTGRQLEQVFDLILRAGYNPHRLEILKELFTSKAIPGSHIQLLTWSKWREALTPTQTNDLVTIASRDRGATARAISFIANYLHTSPQAIEVLKETALELLSREDDGEPEKSHRTMENHYWDELAKRLVKMAPDQVAKAILKEIASRRSSFEKTLVGVLEEAWTISDKVALFRQVIAPWLDAETSEGWWVRRAIECFPLVQVGLEELARWVSEKPEQRARTLAHIIGAPIGRPSDLHAMLLERFVDYDVGSAFYGSFISGSWSGPTSVRTRGKIEEAKSWLEDDRPVIREWAGPVLKSLEETLKRDLKAEEEERFR